MKQLAVCAWSILTVAALFAPCPRTASAVPEEMDHVRREFPPDTYTQNLRVTFRDSATAAKASVRIAPLYDGYERAVSCRWDDNQDQDIEVKKRLDMHGVKATWYLNSLDAAYHRGSDFLPIARTLLEGGHSIGSHTSTHPYITYVHRNRAFQELAEARINWESDLDTLVLSHAFSFVDYRSRAEGDAVQADLIRLLERAGLYHLSVFKNFDDDLRSDMILSIIMPPENAPFDDFVRAVDWAVDSEELRERFPLISHSMHGWYDTPLLPQYGLDELDKRLAHLNSFPNFWQCNQNQYATYRAQYEYGAVGIARREGATVELVVRRPLLRFLNDPIPVTLVLDGVAPDAIAHIEADGAEVDISPRSNADAALVNLSHTPRQFLPHKVGRVTNPENRTALEPSDIDPDFPDIQALLSFDGQELALQLRNVGDVPITDATITFRLPLGWAEGVAVRSLPALGAGRALRETLRPTRRDSSPGLHVGKAYFVAQIDFRVGDAPGRLHATCNFENPPDASFPKGRFGVLGPIAPEAFDATAFAAAIREGGAPSATWSLADGTAIAWRPGATDGSVPDEFLHHEVIRTQGEWFLNQSPLYVLHSVVESPDARPVRIECAREDVPLLYLNGTEVTGQDAILQAGPNHLVLVYHHATQFNLACHSGCFLRLSDPATGSRLRDVTYAIPRQEAPMATQQDAIPAAANAPKILKTALLKMIPRETTTTRIRAIRSWPRNDRR